MSGRSSDIQRLTEAGVDLVFNKAVKAPKRKYYPQIVTEKMQEKVIGKYDTIGDMGPAADHVEGDVFSFDKFSQNYETTITSTRRYKAVESSREELENDLYNVVQSRFGTPLINKLVQKKERIVADAYNDGFTTTGADGVAVFAATHPLQRSASVNDNLATGALTPENLILAKNKFNATYDQAGEFYDTMPTHLLIHPNKIYDAIAILESQLLAFQLSNTKNTLQAVDALQIITNKYLDFTNVTNVSPWFLLDKTMDDAGCILQVQKGYYLNTWWENNNDVFRGVAHEKYGVSFISPGYGAVGSTGA
jgi:phage major head subunit gpT-like protein